MFVQLWFKSIVFNNYKINFFILYICYIIFDQIFFLQLDNVNATDMPSHCAVPMCPNQTLDSTKSCNDVLFHKFPSDIKVLEKWLKFCNDSENKNTSLVDYQNAQICSRHFHKDNYYTFATDVIYILILM